MSLVTAYKQVGIVDGCEPSTFSMDKFSLANKQNEIQRSASTLKIQRLRKTYDSLIKIEQPKEPAPGDEKDAKEKVKEAVVEIDNPFT